MADDFDMRMHQGTYGSFMTLLKWGSISVIALLVFLGIFVA